MRRPASNTSQGPSHFFFPGNGFPLVVFSIGNGLFPPFRGNHQHNLTGEVARGKASRYRGLCPLLPRSDLWQRMCVPPGYC